MSKKSKKEHDQNDKVEKAEIVDIDQDMEEVFEEADEETSEETLEQQLATAKEDAAKHKEDFLLASAEAENIRKRAQNEMIAARKFAVEKFASELLSVRDSLDLASALEIDGDDAEVVKKMHEGLALTLKQLDTVFEKFEISVINPEGEKFNPDHHQAISAIESDELAPNHIIDVMQKGYLLNQRLLRPAMVVVSKAPAKEATD